MPADAPLALWHDGSRAFDRENPRSITGRIGSLLPVLISGGSYFVVAGEVDDEDVGHVRLLFSEPGQELYQEQIMRVTDVRGRRVWLSHPEKMRRRTVATVVWLRGGESESVTVPTGE